MISNARQTGGMMSNRKAATPLRVAGEVQMKVLSHDMGILRRDRAKLIETLRYMIDEVSAWQPDNPSWQEGEEEADCFRKARALLHELGEQP